MYNSELKGLFTLKEFLDKYNTHLRTPKDWFIIERFFKKIKIPVLYMWQPFCQIVYTERETVAEIPGFVLYNYLKAPRNIY